jgi:hypothetical protein
MHFLLNHPELRADIVETLKVTPRLTLPFNIKRSSQVDSNSLKNDEELGRVRGVS